jgi:glyoxylase I family protein
MSSAIDAEKSRKTSGTTFSHMGLVCQDPIAVERFYTRYFGFTRGRVYTPGPDQVVMIRSGDAYLELFPATESTDAPPPKGAGPEYPGWRHLAFLVDDLDAKLEEMGEDARITLGPLDMGVYIPGMRVAWVADPEGNIVELNQGYVDEPNPPALRDEAG